MQNNKFLLPEDDGLRVRESGRWASEKINYLERYIGIFETSMRKKWSSRNYIDLFSGPGKIRERKTGVISLGSPLIALTTKFPFTGYYFVDLNPDEIEALEKRISASPDASSVSIQVGDANTLVQSIVDEISQSSLNLAFLDPEGIDLKWSTVETLASHPRIDLIIHYPQMGLSRSMPNSIDSTERTKVDGFFGSQDWIPIFEKHRSGEEKFLHRQLMDHYKGRLYDLGYKDVFRDDEVGIEPLMSTEYNAPLYRLLFASKHPLGNDFWRKITAKNPHGQRRLF